MGYNPRHRYKTYQLSPEECELKHALREYTYDPERTTAFCAINVLFTEYQRYTMQLSHREYGVVTLTRQQFGIALRRVFGLASTDRSRRWLNGTRVYGYVGFVGPGSIDIGNYWGGRRPKDHDYFLED